jgi:transmembrane sensor
LDELRAVWAEGGRSKVGGIGTWDSDQIWNAVSAKLDDEQPRSLRLVVPDPKTRVATIGMKPRRDRTGWAAAAACAILFTGIWGGRQLARERVGSLPPVREVVREYRTDRGQRASVTLPDGSAFQLAPMSVLRVPAAYGAPERVVELEGDGYFNVAHDPAHPFSVRTARTTIRDVGTRFIVRARPTESRVEVAVAEGEVSIEPRSNTDGTTPVARISRKPRTLTVSAGQVALIDERGIAKLLARASVTSRFAWTRGELDFSNVLVPNVLAELSRWYGDTFVLADKSLETVRLTTVLKGETLLEALVVLETALDVDTRIHGDTVTLTRHRPEGETP